jgi:hypothetical protein
MTDEEADRIFGNGLIILGGRWDIPLKTPREDPAVLDEKGDPVLDGSINSVASRST